MNWDPTAAETVKVVVAGPFAAGKTSFITHLSQTPVVSTETATSGDEADRKAGTTVSMDYGTFTVGSGDEAVQLLLFGTPGQARFRFMLDVAAVGMDGFILILDGTDPTSHTDAADILRTLEAHGSVPFLVAVNRLDDDEEAKEVAASIRSDLADVARPVDVRDAASTAAILLDLLLTMTDSLLEKSTA
ncbi:GTP-binding protein [Euzebya tangerina]|uniref:GTP-binding protein n=1 Tax=Euzebya tangerina TaxID=591198 RepID=UPI000E30BFFF|nr:ATP/GTP-binding protein [Euzebya tangerina]